MRIRSLVFLFGALTLSTPCSAATNAPIAPVAGSSEYRFLTMEKALPGFGGMFLDDNGELTVYMLHPEIGGSAIDASLRASPLLTSKEAAAALNVLQGQYSFSALAHWRDRLVPTLVKGVVFLDIDETRNRLVIGVSDPAAIRAVKNNVIASKIPQQAVIIEKAAPFHELKTVDDPFRPVTGGVKIEQGNALAIVHPCTVGFNAILDAATGFVTASHCTETQGHPDATAFFQPEVTLSGKNLIGHELRDPPFFSHPICPTMKCRYSDSAFVKYDSATGSTLGAIARTTETPGSKIINQTTPYRITKEDCGGLGDLVQKVGSTTGWTTGKIVRTCITSETETPGLWMLPCQNEVIPLDNTTAIAGKGDSGSPVFLNHADGTVSLAGILWAGTKLNSFIYSCIGSIKRDLGQQLITYRHPAGTPMITGVTFPSSIPGDSAPHDGTVTFTDDDKGVNWAQFDVLQSTCGPVGANCSTPFGFDPGISDRYNGQFGFNMWCKGDFYWTMEVTLRDVQGHVSDPYIFSVKCDPLLARAAPITREVSGERESGGGP